MEKRVAVNFRTGIWSISFYPAELAEKAAWVGIALELYAVGSIFERNERSIRRMESLVVIVLILKRFFGLVCLVVRFLGWRIYCGGESKVIPPVFAVRASTPPGSSTDESHKALGFCWPSEKSLVQSFQQTNLFQRASLPFPIHSDLAKARFESILGNRDTACIEHSPVSNDQIPPSDLSGPKATHEGHCPTAGSPV